MSKNDPNRFKNSIIERARQNINTGREDPRSKDLANINNQKNQLGERARPIQPIRPPPPKPTKETESPSIWDRWVEFRDNYLANPIDNGFRKMGYTGKFVFKRVVNSDTAYNLKEKAKHESLSLVDRIRRLSLKDSVKEKFSEKKEAMKEKLWKGRDMAKDRFEEEKNKFEQGTTYWEEGGREKFEANKDSMKKKFEQGGQIFKETFEQGREALKEQIEKGRVVAEEVTREQMERGRSGIKDSYEQGSNVIREKANNVAGNVYETQEKVAKSAGRFSRRVGMLVFVGVMGVSFAYALGGKLPQAYFDYQLKKKQMEVEKEGGKDRKEGEKK